MAHRSSSAPPPGRVPQQHSMCSTPVRNQRWGTPPRTPANSYVAGLSSGRRPAASPSAKKQFSVESRFAPSPFAFASPCRQVRGKPPVAPRPADIGRERLTRAPQERGSSPASGSSYAPSLSDAASAAMLHATQSGDLDFSGYSADEWSTATSLWRLEALRRRVTNVRKEGVTLREELAENIVARNEWETRMALNRWRVRELREEELSASEVAVAANDGRTVSSSSRSEIVSACNDHENATLRAETEVLAQEVSLASTQQIARGHSIRRLRTVARLANLRRAARVAVEARRRLRVECRSVVLETTAASEDAAAARARARGLRIELTVAESDGHMVTRCTNDLVHNSLGVGALGNGLRFAEERVAALRGEVEIEQQRAQIDSIADATYEQEQVVMQRQSAELSLRLSSVQANSRVLTHALKNAERQKDGLSMELVEVRRRVESLRANADSTDLATRMLEAELQQQRDATLAWRAYADELVDGHHSISLEAAEAARACRKTMGMTWMDDGYAGEKALPMHSLTLPRWARLAG